MGGGRSEDLTPGPSPPSGEGWIPTFAGLRGPGSAAVRGVGGVLVGLRIGEVVGSGRSARQALLAQPAQADRRGCGGDGRGTQTVMARLARHSGERPAMTRCPRGGTLTVLTRRPGLGGQGYVSTRCRSSGTQAAMPRRAQGGVGSLMTRCPRLGGGATVVCRHDDVCTFLPGGARCSRMVLHLPHPNAKPYWGEVGEDNGGLSESGFTRLEDGPDEGS